MNEAESCPLYFEEAESCPLYFAHSLFPKHALLLKPEHLENTYHTPLLLKNPRCVLASRQNLLKNFHCSASFPKNIRVIQPKTRYSDHQRENLKRQLLVIIHPPVALNHIRPENIKKGILKLSENIPPLGWVHRLVQSSFR